MVIHRGEIWWATLPEAEGSAPGFRRPVLVAQSDAFNSSRIQTIVVVALTSNLRLANAPGNVHVSQRQSGLPRDSVVNVSQILTIDRSYLTEQVGTLPVRLMQQVDEGLRLVMSL